MTLKQIKSLKEFRDLFNSGKALYTVSLEEPITMMPYRYEKEISLFVNYCYENDFVLNDYHEIETTLVKKYEDLLWFTQLSEKQLMQCVSFCIRKDRFVDGFLAARIEDGTINRIIEALILVK